jgi:hypothetical protein
MLEMIDVANYSLTVLADYKAKYPRFIGYLA